MSININKLILLALFFIFLSFILFYYFSQPKYKIVYYREEKGNVTINNKIIEYFVKTFYVNNSYVNEFYVYYFKNEEDKNYYLDYIFELAKRENISFKDINIKNLKGKYLEIQNESMKNNKGLIIEKQNILIFVNIKNFEKDIDKVKWLIDKL